MRLLNIFFIVPINLFVLYAVIYYFLLAYQLTGYAMPIAFMCLFSWFIYLWFELRRGFRFSVRSMLLTRFVGKQTTLSALLIVCIVGIFTYFYTHTYEDYLGGRDPGTYVSIAENIQQNQAINFHLDSLTKAYAEGTVDQLYHTEPKRPERIGHKGYYFVGYYITDASIGELTPQFFHLSSVLASFWLKAFGIIHLPYLMPTITLFTLIAFIIFLKLYLTRSFALIFKSMLFWLTSPALLYWSREFNSEMWLWFFILMFLINAKLYFEKRRAVFLLSAYLMILASLLTRGDAIIFVLLGVLFTVRLHSKKVAWAGALTLGLSTALAYGMLIQTSYPYFYAQFGRLFKSIELNEFIFRNLGVFFAYLLGAGIVILTLLLRWFVQGKVFSKAVKKVFDIYRKIAVLLGVLIMSVLMIIYEWTGQTLSFYSNRQNVIKLSWYLGGVIGLIVLIIGLILLFRFLLVHMKRKASVFMLSGLVLIMVFFTVVFLHNAQISSDHPWWSRRFLVYTLPLLPMAYIALSQWLRRRVRFGSFISVVVFISLVSINLMYARPIFAVQQYKGSYNFLKQVDSCLDSDKQSIVFFDTTWGINNFEQRLPYIAGYLLGQPLWVYFDHVVYFPKENITSVTLVKLATKSADNGIPTYIINPTDETLRISKKHLRKTCSLSFDVQQLGWRGLAEPRRLFEDAKLDMDSVVRYTLPVEIYSIF